MKFLPDEAFTFDDVLLVPDYSEIASRQDVDISTKLPGIGHLGVPIISANMDSVTGPEMARAMWKAGGLGILHRFAPHEEQDKWLKQAEIENWHAIPSIGVSREDVAWLKEAYVEHKITTVCIDIAHGHSKHVEDTIRELKHFSNDQLKIIAGNVATLAGAQALKSAGADVIKCGIGPGCFTPGTQVETDNGPKNIEDVSNLDRVLTHNGNMSRVAKTMSYRFKGDLIKIITKASSPIICTATHEIYAQTLGGHTCWEPAHSLSPSHSLIRPDGSSESIIKVEAIKYDGLVYDLSIRGDNSYTASGFSVHNSLCSTRTTTGHGVPQLTAIIETCKAGLPIIADGGIRTSGDIVKALAAGASAVMIGGILAGTPEAPVVIVNGKRVYRGMASESAQMARRGFVSNDAPEGATREVEAKESAVKIIQRLSGGIRSGLSYSGATNLAELRDRATFVKVAHGVHSENGIHFKG